VNNLLEFIKSHKDNFIEMDKGYEKANAALEEFKNKEFENSFSDCIKPE
jgi:hypothetical protein